MQKINDTQYLMQEQYKDSSNLSARMELHKRFSTNPQGWINWVWDILAQFPEHIRVLELGCGTGALWQECADRVPANWVITLSDLSDGMLDTAWRNLIVTGRNYKFEQIDAQAIPYPEQTFDLVVANHMLYHVPDIKKALSEIQRVLKDGGYLIAATGGENHLREIWNWIQHASPDKYYEAPLSFTLENGKSQLAEFFSQVELLRYEDNLNITEVEPLLAYIKSGIRAANLDEVELSKLEDQLSTMLAKDGKIFVTKDSGLFKAIK